MTLEGLLHARFPDLMSLGLRSNSLGAKDEKVPQRSRRKRYARIGLAVFTPLRFRPSCATIPRRIGGTAMHKRFLITLLCVLAFGLPSIAAHKPKKTNSSGAPDEAYLQKILEGWSAMNVANMAQYYDQGDYNFFDLAPLKYRNWAEYEKGVTELLKAYKSLKL